VSAEEREITGVRYAVIRFIIFLCVCTVVLGLAEIVLRVYPPFKLNVTGNRIVLPANRTYTFDSRQNSHLSTVAAHKLDAVITHTKNSIGFRGPEPPRSMGDYLSVITVGGSTTECFYLSDGSTWPDRLGAMLSRTFSPFWLNNAGLDGHSTVGHTVLLQDYISPLKPKIVLFLFGINDLYVERAATFDRGVQRAGIDLSSPKSVFVSAANYSQVLAIPLNIYRDFRAERLGIAHNLADLSGLSTRVVSNSERSKALDDYARGLPAFEQRLAHLVELSRSSGIEPVFMTQPMLYGRGTDDVTGINLELVSVGELNGKVVWDALEMYNDATRGFGKREEILVIDLAASLPKSSEYYYDLFHYSNAGAAKVAEIIYLSLCPFLAAKFPSYASGKCEAPSAPHP
jgi:hypothetical protein